MLKDIVFLNKPNFTILLIIIENKDNMKFKTKDKQNLIKLKI